MKNDQDGSKNFRPRHCYANPEDYSVCPITAIFEYLCCSPDILQDPDSLLFPGSEQDNRFRKILKRHLEKHRGDLDGYEVEDIGTHSIRKGATTFASSGSTASPSSVAINNRGGWTLGTVRDVYMLYEKAGDHYVGRILAGLPVLSSRFAVSEPNFWTLNPLDHDARAKQVEIDAQVSAVLQSLFGDILLRQVTVVPFLRVGLACVLHHKTAMNNTCHKCHSIVKLTAIYTSPDIVDIEHFVSVRVPFDEGNFAIKLTGIPPHVAHLAAISGLKGDMAKIVPSLLMEIQKMLDDRTFGGVLSETRMEALIEKLVGSKIKGIHDEMRKLGNNSQKVGDDGNAKISHKQWTSSELFLHPYDGVLRRVPIGWQFPQCTLSVAYCLWHFGDQVKKIGPLKYLDYHDVNFPTVSGTSADGVCTIWQGCKRGVHYLDEFRTIMIRSDAAAKAKGLLQAPLTRQKVLMALEQCKDCLGVAPQTNKGRKRQLAGIQWATYFKLMPDKKRPKRQCALSRVTMID